MKILKEGEPVNSWFIGKEIACKSCGLVGELDENEKFRAGLKYLDQDQIEIYCPNCGTLMKAFK